MTEVEPFNFIVPFVEGEIDNPAVGDFVGILEVEVVGEGGAEFAEDFVDFDTLVSAEEDGVTCLGAGELGDV